MRWLFSSLGGYQKAWLPRDLVAGLTVWAVLVPEALAYASIAGVSPEVGLYAAPSALLFYAAFGSSRHLVVGPMSATAALSAAGVGSVVAGNAGTYAALTATLAITTGVLALIAGLARLGFIANFISEPVLKGFIIGLVLTIMIGQVPKLLGVGKGTGDFFAQLGHILSELGEVSGSTVLVGGASLAVLLGLRHFAPKIPASLVVVLVGIVVAKAAHLAAHGVELVGHIPSGLPHYGFPRVGTESYLHLAAPAVGIVLVGFAEGLGAAKTYAAKERYDIDANRELIGLGAANVASGLSSAMVVNGSLSKTAVNGGAGAKTQASGLIVAVLTVVTLLVLTGLFEDLPETTLAAVVIAAVVELVDVGAMQRLYRCVSGPLKAMYGPAARADFIALRVQPSSASWSLTPCPDFSSESGHRPSCSSTRRLARTWPSSGSIRRTRIATSIAHETHVPSRQSAWSSCGWRARCSSPTRTAWRRSSGSPAPERTCAPSSSTPRRWRLLT